MDPLQQELHDLLKDSVDRALVRAMAYPPDDWYGIVQRKLFFEANPKFEPVGMHRLRELSRHVVTYVWME